jgi:flagellar assembly factor FliW
MEIRTTRFGTLEFPDEMILKVAGGLLGFSHAESYVVFEHDADGSPFKWFQAADDPNLAFIIMDPHQIVPDYLNRTEKDVRDAIGPFDPQDISTIAIVTVPADRPIEMTANLRAPIVIKFSERTGKQIILTDDQFNLNHRIFDGASIPQKAAAR